MKSKNQNFVLLSSTFQEQILVLKGKILLQKQQYSFYEAFKFQGAKFWFLGPKFQFLVKELAHRSGSLFSLIEVHIFSGKTLLVFIILYLFVSSYVCRAFPELSQAFEGIIKLLSEPVSEFLRLFRIFLIPGGFSYSQIFPEVSKKPKRFFHAFSSRLALRVPSLQTISNPQKKQSLVTLTRSQGKHKKHRVKGKLFSL